MPGNNLPTFGNTQYAQQPQQTSGAFGFSRSLVSGPTTNTMNNWDLYNYGLKNDLFKGTNINNINDFMNDKNQNWYQATRDSYVAQNGLQNYTSDSKNGIALQWTNPAEYKTNFNLGGFLGDTTNVLNAAIGGWNLYENMATYGDRKDLLKTSKKTAEAQYEQLTRDMADIKQERERRDRMRSNATTQRANTSNVSSW